ncbi:hypothetical protein [Metasolibacillus meyeri]|uniref:hypothetical protein n=1 Tax=Metasolibacillus meyeri TaxID=1071052 RepID=UPI000D3052CF|nr:hypothetical protein [Metasolibacillus meyeri]
MMHIKMKTKGFRLIIPVPYLLLKIAVAILSSAFISRQINKWIDASAENAKKHFPFPLLEKETLIPLIKDLKNYKGLTLVDIKAQDGTELSIKL